MGGSETIREKTKRTSGDSLGTICKNLNLTLRGWFGYFKYSKTNALERVDGYVRGRLRSALRKRAGRKGRGRGIDHQRWPNAYFHAQGLLSLTQLQKAIIQSS